MANEITLPANLDPAALAPASPAHLVPALIADARDAAGWRYIDFFTATIRNANTRRAYMRALLRLVWRSRPRARFHPAL